MTDWKLMSDAPRDGRQIIVLINSATVPIVRTAWFDDGDQGLGDEVDDMVGWWSYRHSVAQEKLIGNDLPIAWMPMPDDTLGRWMSIWPA